jgi:N-acetylneuraminic acid mutarotase
MRYVALEDGGILAVGGYVDTEVDREPTNLVERYDPRQNRWFKVPMATPRVDATTVRLADGRVLVAGGFTGDDVNGRPLADVEVFDPTSGRWTTMPGLIEPRYGANAVVLNDGSVLLMGGHSDFNVYGDTPWCPAPMTSVERFSPPLP